MTRRAISAERAARLQQATAASVLDHLRAAGGGVPANILAAGLATALAEMIGRQVAAKHRAETAARCMSIMGAAEGRKR